VIKVPALCAISVGKPPTLEAIAAMRRLSEMLLPMEKPILLPNCSPSTSNEARGIGETLRVQ
jgi:hypothetical protein